jgi:hypothetical protein
MLRRCFDVAAGIPLAAHMVKNSITTKGYAMVLGYRCRMANGYRLTGSIEGCRLTDLAIDD